MNTWDTRARWSGVISDSSQGNPLSRPSKYHIAIEKVASVRVGAMIRGRVMVLAKSLPFVLLVFFVLGDVSSLVPYERA